MPQKPAGTAGYQRQLWDHFPHKEEDRWLPAAVVFGEGIFIRFAESPLREWEEWVEESGYLRDLRTRALESFASSNRDPVEVSPRLVMLHTLSHLLIRRLSFECGYSSSSLKERLYVNFNQADPSENMAGILIYTASGDCEGSLGGLVRLGEPQELEKLLRDSVKDASWCSSDPVCTEIGTNGGQGTDGLNVAACHCCALLPETSCEQFNRFLDRSLVAGRPDNRKIGFFSDIL